MSPRASTDSSRSPSTCSSKRWLRSPTTASSERRRGCGRRLAGCLHRAASSSSAVRLRANRRRAESALERDVEAVGVWTHRLAQLGGVDPEVAFEVVDHAAVATARAGDHELLHRCTRFWRVLLVGGRVDALDHLYIASPELVEWHVYVAI